MIKFRKNLITVQDVFKRKNSNVKDLFIDMLETSWQIIIDSKDELKRILISYEFFKFYNEKFSVPFKVLVNLLQKYFPA